jgi:hypothetical protein
VHIMERNERLKLTRLHGPNGMDSITLAPFFCWILLLAVAAYAALQVVFIRVHSRFT